MTKHTTQETTNEIPYGTCACGCGQKPALADRTSEKHGWIKGQPKSFIRGHNGRKSLVEAFWAYCKPGNPDECWLWTGPINDDGYGRFRFGGGKKRYAHRVAYELFRGPIPDGLNCLHNCPNGDNPACCNPAHLFTGTQTENIADMNAKGRHGNMQGEHNAFAKLTEADIIEIRRLWKEKVPGPVIAKKFAINNAYPWAIAHYKAWKHIP